MNGTAMSFGSVGFDVSVRERIAARLRNMGVTAKAAARRIGVTPRTVENWRAANSEMSASALIALCREYESVWQEVKELSGRANTIGEAEAMLDQMQKLLVERKRG